MAQEIVTWCDLHLDNDEKVNGHTVTIALNGTQSRQLDVCDDCHKSLLGDLIDALDAFGRREHQARKVRAKPTQQPKTSSTSTGLVCPLPDCDSRHRSREAIRQHLTTQHPGISLPVAEGPHGATVDGKPLNHFCDICPAAFPTKGGLAAHVGREH